MRSFPVILGLTAAALLAPWSAHEARAQGVAPAAVETASASPSARVIVKYKPDALSASRATILAVDTTPLAVRLSNRAASLAQRSGLALAVGGAIGSRAHVVSATGMSSEQLAQRLAADSDVEYAAPDRLRKRYAVPSDTYYATRPYNSASAPTSGGPLVGQWYLKPPGAPGTAAATAPSAINAEGAWDRTTGSPAIVVAVLDTGIRFDHADFRTVAAGGNLLPGYDMIVDDQTSADGQPGRDADASDPGDAVTQADVNNHVPGCTVSDIATSSWHGTETAGLIGAVTDNARGIASVGRNVQILPVRVLGKCGGYDSDIVAGMLWAAGIEVPGVPTNPNPARVINLSLGGTGACDSTNPSSSVYADAIAQVTAKNNGTVVVASAGNSAGHGVSIPADCPGVIGVAGVRHIGTKVGFSDIGPEITISAPAGNCINTNAGSPCLYPILTTTNAGTGAPVSDAAGGSTYTDSLTNVAVGTSFAAPLVAGTAALMLSIEPRLVPSEVRAKLQVSARPFPQPATDENGTALQACVAPTASSPDQLQCTCSVGICGAGMLDAAAAVAAAGHAQVRVGVTPAAPVAGQAVTLNAAPLLPAGVTIVAYQWSLTDAGGIAPALTGTTQPSIAVVPSGAGTFTVTLTVTDSLGASSSVVTPVNVAAAPVPPSSGGGGGAFDLEWLALLGAAVVAIRIGERRRARRA